MKELIKKSWKHAAIVLLMVAAYVSTVALLDYISENPNWWISSLTFTYPQLLLTLNSLIAIENFSGGMLESTKYWAMNTYLIVGLIVTLIIVPFVYVRASLDKKAKNTYSFLWYVSAALVTMTIYAGTFGTAFGLYEFKGKWASSYKSAEKDEAKSVLSDASFKVAELMLLPEEFGGGSGSFSNLLGDNGEHISEVSELILDDHSEFTLSIGEQIQDSTVIIYLHRNTADKNAPAEKSEFVASISPLSEKIVTFSF